MDLSKIVIPEVAKFAVPIVTCQIEGILTEEDLRQIAMPGGGSIDSTPDTSQAAVIVENPADLKRVREKHHSVARMIAQGMSQRMTAMICGYDENYLSILLNNPAMRELVEMYRIQQGAAATVVAEKLRTVGLKAVEKLEEKMERDELNNQELLGTAKLGLDRGGHGPSSTQHVKNESHIIDHAALTELNNEARRRSAPFIVPMKQVRGAIVPPKADDNA